MAVTSERSAAFVSFEVRGIPSSKSRAPARVGGGPDEIVDDDIQASLEYIQSSVNMISRFETQSSNARKEAIMKIVVVGGSGLIGSRLVNKLREHGHEAVAASPGSGVNTLTCEGLAQALKGAAAVVDVTNSPSWEDAAVMNFFETSTRNLLTYEGAAGVGHHVALSVVGTERLLASGFFRAKMAQENLIKDSSVPYTIIRATQFFEFVKAIADFSTEGNKVRMPLALIQPMAADDVASAVERVATGSPLNGTVEVGGPEQFRLDELVRQRLAADNDPREVVADPQGRYYGIDVSERALLPGADARLGETRFKTWLTQFAAQRPSKNAQSAARTAATH